MSQRPVSSCLSGATAAWAKPAIGLGHERAPFLARDHPFEERLGHRGGDLGIAVAGEPRECRRIEVRPRRGHVEAAIGGEPGDERILEGKARRRRAPVTGGDVGHVRPERLVVIDNQASALRHAPQYGRNIKYLQYVI